MPGKGGLNDLRTRNVPLRVGGAIIVYIIELEVWTSVAECLGPCNIPSSCLYSKSGRQLVLSPDP